MLHFLVEELQNLVGKRVKKVTKWLKTYSFLIGKEMLSVSVDPELPIIARGRIEIGGTPVMRNLWSKRLNNIEAISWERIVKIGIGRDDLYFFLAKGARVLKKQPTLPSGQRMDPDQVVEMVFESEKDLIKQVKGIDLSLARQIIKEINLETMIGGLNNRKLQFKIEEETILPVKKGDYERINDAAFILLQRLVDAKRQQIEKKRSKLAQKRRERIAKRIEMLGDPESLRLKGDAILAFPDLVSGKAGKIILPDPNNLKEKLSVDVDPRLSPQKLAQRYYRKYKRAKTNLENLKRILDKPEKIRRDEEQPLPYHLFQTKNKFEILVGKSARSNELITFKIARPKDLFFHIRGYSGAHVILRTRGKKPSRSDIIEAASYAVRFSKAKQSTHVPVSYALRADIKKGKTPGTIIFKKEKVLFADPG